MDRQARVNTFHGEVRDGRLYMLNRRQYDDYLTRLEGLPVAITIDRMYGVRSGMANRYYWGVVVRTLAVFTGYTKNEMHDVLKIQFLAPVTIGVGGEVMKGVPSTRKLTTIDFFEYVESIRLWAGERLQCYIPQPTSAEERQIKEDAGDDGVVNLG